VTYKQQFKSQLTSAQPAVKDRCTHSDNLTSQSNAADKHRKWSQTADLLAHVDTPTPKCILRTQLVSITLLTITSREYTNRAYIGDPMLPVGQ